MNLATDNLLESRSGERDSSEIRPDIAGQRPDTGQDRPVGQQVSA